VKGIIDTGVSFSITKAVPLRFVGWFLAFFSIFSVCYSLARGTVIERLVVDDVTVKTSAAVIQYFSPQLGVRADEHRIVSNRARLSILNGCEGIESIFLLLAAILAFPASWRRKLAGAVLGIVFVYLINQLRITSLFYLLLYDQPLFHFTHALAAPTIIVMLIVVYFLYWANRASQTDKHYG
jgi:exosortase family protein XrtM